MNAFLVQHGSGHYAAYLERTAPLHRAYAERHKLELILHHEKADPAPFSRNSEGLVWLLRTLNDMPNEAFIGYMDADVIVKNPTVDIREGLRDGDEIALLGSLMWLNSGVVFLKNTQALRAYFNEFLKENKENNNEIDVKLNRKLRTSGLRYSFFGHKWNYFPTYGGGIRGCTLDCTEAEAIIKAWHGFDQQTVLTEIDKTIRGMAA